jgi:saccharopine dehydrogenase-like NADP-dependent oxidoreductase
MGRCIDNVAVFGLGKVGELVAAVLRDSGFAVTGYDATPRDGGRRLDVTDGAALAAALEEVDAVISCLPYHCNIPLAEAAAVAETHYFDLTEDVPTTNRVIELAAEHAGAAFAPQCGLAPGLIGIVGSSIAAGFDTIRSIELKVGALPRFPTGQLGYAFNWSPEGVVNEYLNDCEVLRGGRRQLVPAMADTERVVLGGVELEAATTSGGLGTMCQTYEGRVQRLDYKTMRYPGHFEQMRFLFDELGLRDRRELAGELLTAAKPPVDDDIVYLHAAVEGVRDGQALRENFVRGYLPTDIGGRMWRAISWTTACSAVAVMELVADGVLPDTGFIRQEDISLASLTATKAGRRFEQKGRI